MSDATEATYRLWTSSGFQDDEWRHGEDAAALTSNRRVILPMAVLLDLEPQVLADTLPRLGALVAPGESIDPVVELLPGLTMIALAFPAFNDGRSFSKAELLRSRHGYEGRLRASGQVLVDQFPHMMRVGFDEFEISNPALIRRLESGQPGGLNVHFQPTAKAAQADQGYSWRRRSSS